MPILLGGFPSVEPHVASNVRYIAFSMRTNSLLTRPQATCGTLLTMGKGALCTPCYLDFYWGSPQPILTPNYTIPHIASVNQKKHLDKYLPKSVSKLN